MATPSRLPSSIALRVRKRRPQLSASRMKSGAQMSLSRGGAVRTCRKRGGTRRASVAADSAAARSTGGARACDSLLLESQPVVALPWPKVWAP